MAPSFSHSVTVLRMSLNSNGSSVPDWWDQKCLWAPGCYLSIAVKDRREVIVELTDNPALGSPGRLAEFPHEEGHTDKSEYIYRVHIPHMPSREFQGKGFHTRLLSSFIRTPSCSVLAQNFIWLPFWLPWQALWDACLSWRNWDLQGKWFGQAPQPSRQSVLTRDNCWVLTIVLLPTSTCGIWMSS